MHQREFVGAQRDPEWIYAGHRLLRRLAGMQTAYDIEPIGTVIVEIGPLWLDHCLHGDGNVEIRMPAPNHGVKSWRCNPHNGERIAIDEERLADHGCLRETAR